MICKIGYMMGEKKDLSPQCIYRDFKYNSLINKA